MVSRQTGAAIVGAAALAGVVATVPTVWSPLNVIGFIPAIWLSLLFGSAAVIAPVPVFAGAFAWWCPPVWGGQSAVPLRSRIATGVALVLSVTSVAAGREYGLKYQGAHYVQVVTAVSILWWLVVAGFAALASLRPSAARNLWFHVTLFSWLAWYAVPYMGELP